MSALYPILFNIFFEKIMADTLEDHEGTVSIRGRTITNLRFADDFDGLAGQEQELAKLVNHLQEASTAYGIQISAEKTQLVTNNTSGISTDITIDNKKRETVGSFKYLGAHSLTHSHFYHYLKISCPPTSALNCNVRGQVNWHTIYWSLGMQFVLAVLVMRLKGGQEVILWVQTRLDGFFASSKPAARLIFGDSYQDHYIIFGVWS